MKRAICLLMAIVTISVSFIYPVSAAESDTTISPMASSFFASHCTSLEKTSTTSFKVWFDVVACGMMDELGVSEVEIQRSSDAATWTRMRICYPSHYSQMICEDTFAHGSYIAYNDGIKGYYYRAIVTFYAKNSTGSATRFRYTDVIKL